MKTIGYLLIALALTLGVVAACTAYLPRLDLPDEILTGLTLNAPAGRQTAGDGAVTPLARDEETLTAGRLEILREAGVERVRVKEFSWRRWSHKGWFLGAVGGLLAGAALVRSGERSKVAQRSEATGRTGLTPDRAVEKVREVIAGLRERLPGLADDAARCQAIVTELSAVQSTYVPAFVEARPDLIRQHGLAGFAELMDRFAAAERQVNRAWSAAADGVYEEAGECLVLGAELWDRVREPLT